jgi:DNA-binding MarR family transcriptional regulator
VTRSAVPAAPPPIEFRIVNWVGIVDQLASERGRRVLAALDLPLPQFVMLNHFSHRPQETKTVGGVASALQQPQPGVTKTMQKLVRRGLIAVEPSPADARSKILRVTSKGLALHARAIALLMPELAQAFDGWSEADKRALFAGLDRLKLWLDAHR